MPFDADDYTPLRKDVGTTEAACDDDSADDVLEEGAAKYPTNAEAAAAYARVRACEQLWAQSVNEDADYTQNEESEKLGARTAKRKELLDYWEGELEGVLAGAATPKGQRPAFFGLAKASNKRWYP